MKVILFVVVLSGLLFSCRSFDKSESPEGSFGNICVKSGENYFGEFLILNDDTLTILHSNSSYDSKYSIRNFLKIGLNNIKSIEIEGYADRSWVGGVIALQVIPAILLNIAAMSVDEDNFPATLTFFLPAALTTIFFEASTPPKPSFKMPFTPQMKEDLKVYTRFPQNLTDEQYKIFIAQNKVANVYIIK